MPTEENNKLIEKKTIPSSVENLRLRLEAFREVMAAITPIFSEVEILILRGGVLIVFCWQIARFIREHR